VPPTDLDLARPQTAGEEELQLQLALAMSREEAEKEDEKRRSDDVRLALAISQSQEGGAIVGYSISFISLFSYLLEFSHDSGDLSTR
jgi:epsin